MREKHYIILVLMMAICLISPLGFQAQDQNSQGGKPNATKVPIKNKKEPSPIARPHAPSRQQIDCYYLDGILYIEFLLPEGECQMTVTYDCGIEDYLFSSTIPSEIYMGELDEFDIEIETENGNTYEGGIH